MTRNARAGTRILGVADGKGTGRVQACEPPRRLLVLTRDAGTHDATSEAGGAPVCVGRRSRAHFLAPALRTE